MGPDETAYGYYPRDLQKGEGPSMLVCLADCPNAYGGIDDPYYWNVTDPENQNPYDVYVSYEYDPVEGMLFDNGREVLRDEPGASPIVSGFMFPYEDKYLASMACDQQDEELHGVCVYNSLPVFYTWTTDASVPALGRSPVR